MYIYQLMGALQIVEVPCKSVGPCKYCKHLQCTVHIQLLPPTCPVKINWTETRYLGKSAQSCQQLLGMKKADILNIFLFIFGASYSVY